MSGCRLPEEIQPVDVARFQNLLVRDESTGCLHFTGCRGQDGYGRFAVQGRAVAAHRFAFVVAGGVLSPERPHVLHSCPAGDCKTCCEPEHLRAGTNAENAADRASRWQGSKSKKGLPYGVFLRQSGRYAAALWIGPQRRSFGVYASAHQAGAVARYIKEVALGQRGVAS